MANRREFLMGVAAVGWRNCRREVMCMVVEKAKQKPPGTGMIL